MIRLAAALALAASLAACTATPAPQTASGLAVTKTQCQATDIRRGKNKCPPALDAAR